jgi:4-hydroxybenzoate polyprenyltransferase
LFKKLAQSVFYGNYFYGCCTVALALEVAMQMQLPFNSWPFYVDLYCVTVLFYTYAYMQENKGQHINSRNSWYRNHQTLTRVSQIIMLVVSTSISFYLLLQNYSALISIPVIEYLPIIITAIVALAYYGIPLGGQNIINTRQSGWFKPFVIGFVWAIMVTYVPIIWYQVEYNSFIEFNRVNFWLCFKNFMFISELAILFDIKDYAADHNRKLQTFVVRVGLRKTIFYIIIPLTIMGLISLFIFASLLKFPLLRIAINSIPFLLLIIVALSLKRRKPIIYYLAVIDGLMLIKAFCGILAAILVRQ